MDLRPVRVRRVLSLLGLEGNLQAQGTARVRAPGVLPKSRAAWGVAGSFREGEGRLLAVAQWHPFPPFFLVVRFLANPKKGTLFMTWFLDLKPKPEP